MSFLPIVNRLSPRTFFLIDAVGALLSALMLGLVLTQLEHVFGMPRRLLQPLAIIAVIFAGYSAACYWVRPNNWKLFLRIIATANLLYCCLTAGLVISVFPQISTFGWVYFISEIAIIVVLAIAELSKAR